MARYVGPEPCVELARLMAEWREATQHLTEAVESLSGLADRGASREFARLLGAAEVARQSAEAARMRVELHKAEHGC